MTVVNVETGRVAGVEAGTAVLWAVITLALTAGVLILTGSAPVALASGAAIGVATRWVATSIGSVGSTR